MREIDAAEITERVQAPASRRATFCRKTCLMRSSSAREDEESPQGRDVLDQLIENAEIAA